MSWDNKDWWPTNAAHTQREAGIPEGDFEEDVTARHWTLFAVLFVLIVVGPSVPDLLEWML